MTVNSTKRTIRRAMLVIRISSCGILAMSINEPETDGIKQAIMATMTERIVKRVKARNCRKCLWLKNPTQLLIHGPKNNSYERDKVTMMIHFQNAATTDRTVMSTRWLWGITLLTPAWLFRIHRRTFHGFFCCIKLRVPFWNIPWTGQGGRRVTQQAQSKQNRNYAYDSNLVLSKTRELIPRNYNGSQSAREHPEHQKQCNTCRDKILDA